jgi:hypothetical protein
MSKARLRRGRIFLLGLFIGSQAILCGCTDESKTSGTQVAEDPEATAHRKTKGEAYKDKLAKKQAKGAH